MEQETFKKKFMYGAMSTLIYFVILLVILYIPILDIIALFLLPLPFLVYMFKYGVSSTITFSVVILLVTLLILPPIVILTLMACIVGTVMGYFYQQKKGAFVPFMAGLLAYLFSFLLIFVISVYFFGFNFQESMAASMKDIVGFYEDNPIFDQLPLDEDPIAAFKEYIEMVATALPAILISTSLVMVAIQHKINRLVLARFGYYAEALPPFRTWAFPKSVLWYYLISMTLIFLGGLERGTAFYPILFNVHYILEIVMYLQGLAVIAFFSRAKKMGVTLPIIAILLTLLVAPIALVIIRMVGIFELGMGLRSRIKH
jgi:uncharacterized protein YybS (DUF2232 family)